MIQNRKKDSNSDWKDYIGMGSY